MLQAYATSGNLNVYARLREHLSIIFSELMEYEHVHIICLTYRTKLSHLSTLSAPGTVHNQIKSFGISV